MLGGELGQLGDRLDRADLVVGPHDADECHAGRIPLDRLSQGGRAQDAGWLHRQPVGLGVLVLCQPADAVEDGVVLGGRGQNPAPTPGWPPAGPSTGP